MQHYDQDWAKSVLITKESHKAAYKCIWVCDKYIYLRTKKTTDVCDIVTVFQIISSSHLWQQQ